MARKRESLGGSLKSEPPTHISFSAYQYQRLGFLAAFLFAALVVGSWIGNMGMNTGENRIGLASETAIQKGDVDGDGSITREDVYLAYDIVQGAVIPTASQRRAADANGDNSVTIEDVRIIFGKI